ncbi:TPA: hypothetical protein DCZ39_09110 [Patescibacteria group bacterium]|nr:hypothetical protein [Candidatus Gracilibacteria bacterium]
MYYSLLIFVICVGAAIILAALNTGMFSLGQQNYFIKNEATVINSFLTLFGASIISWGIFIVLCVQRFGPKVIAVLQSLM